MNFFSRNPLLITSCHHVNPWRTSFYYTLVNFDIYFISEQNFQKPKASNPARKSNWECEDGKSSSLKYFSEYSSKSFVFRFMSLFPNLLWDLFFLLLKILWIFLSLNLDSWSFNKKHNLNTSVLWVLSNPCIPWAQLIRNMVTKNGFDIFTSIFWARNFCKQIYRIIDTLLSELKVRKLFRTSPPFKVVN